MKLCRKRTYYVQGKDQIASFFFIMPTRLSMIGSCFHKTHHSNHTHLIESSPYHQFSSVQSLSHVQLFATPWIAARQASLSITHSLSSLKLTSIESVMPSRHLILCRPPFLLSPIPPSIRVFSNESTLHISYVSQRGKMGSFLIHLFHCPICSTACKLLLFWFHIYFVYWPSRCSPVWPLT